MSKTLVDEVMLEETLHDIDSATDPDRMSAPEAVAFLEELITDLESRVDALREEHEID